MTQLGHEGGPALSHFPCSRSLSQRGQADGTEPSRGHYGVQCDLPFDADHGPTSGELAFVMPRGEARLPCWNRDSPPREAQ